MSQFFSYDHGGIPDYKGKETVIFWVSTKARNSSTNTFPPVKKGMIFYGHFHIKALYTPERALQHAFLDQHRLQILQEMLCNSDENRNVKVVSRAV